MPIKKTIRVKIANFMLAKRMARLSGFGHRLGKLRRSEIKRWGSRMGDPQIPWLVLAKRAGEPNGVPENHSRALYGRRIPTQFSTAPRQRLARHGIHGEKASYSGR
jgi:hypothetical protein